MFLVRHVFFSLLTIYLSSLCSYFFSPSSLFKYFLLLVFHLLHLFLFFISRFSSASFPPTHSHISFIPSLSLPVPFLFIPPPSVCFQSSFHLFLIPLPLYVTPPPAPPPPLIFNPLSASLSSFYLFLFHVFLDAKAGDMTQILALP